MYWWLDNFSKLAGNADPGPASGDKSRGCGIADHSVGVGGWRRMAQLDNDQADVLGKLATEI